MSGLLGTSAVVLVAPAVMWRPLALAGSGPEAAEARGVPVRALSSAFVIGPGLAVALSMQVVGALLVLTLVVTPAAAVARITASPVDPPRLPTGGRIFKRATACLAQENVRTTCRIRATRSPVAPKRATALRSSRRFSREAGTHFQHVGRSRFGVDRVVEDGTGRSLSSSRRHRNLIASSFENDYRLIRARGGMNMTHGGFSCVPADAC